MSPFDSLPDEVVLKIVTFAAAPPKDNGFRADSGMNRGRWMAENGERYDHDFLANRLSKVSARFERIASDESLWKGVVWIGPRSGLSTIEWVARECLNGGTTSFNMPGQLTGCDYWYWAGCPTKREDLISQFTIFEFSCHSLRNSPTNAKISI